MDFKNHGPGAPSGHGHRIPQPGNPASGHGPGKPHIPNWPALEIRIHKGSTAAHPDFGWSTPDSSALRWLPRPAGYQGLWASLADHSPLHPPVFRPAIRAAAHGDSLRFSLKKTDGVGFEPTRRFHVCRFSRSAKGAPRLATRTPVKSGRNAPDALGNGTTGLRPGGRNRVKPRHNEPNRDHSPDKSATSRERPVSK